MQTIFKQAMDLGIRLAIIPISCLTELKNDIKEFAAASQLNTHQQNIIDNKYILDVPDTELEVRSIVAAIWQHKLAKAIFTYNDKTAECILDDAFVPTENHKLLGQIFAGSGHSIKPVHWFPQKRLAVCSGLTEYGKNNISYAKDWGSFIRIATYISDMPPEDYTWRPVQEMELCASCGICRKHCPTGAILPERFLIDTKKCLALLNSQGNEEFPDWIPKSAHHRLIECTRCQEFCPANHSIVKSITEKITFSQEETITIMNCTNVRELPDVILEKLWMHKTKNTFECVPRNLKAMFNANL